MRPCPRRRRRGFTLLELVLTTGLLVIAAAILIPSLMSMQDSNRLSRTADDLRGLLVGLRTRAIEDGIPYEWGFAAGGTSYFVRAADDAASTSADAAPGVESRVEFDGDSLSGNHALPKGVRLEAQAATGGTMQNRGASQAGPTIRFEPDGTASGTSFRIVDDSSGIVSGRLRTLTGAIDFQRQPLTGAAGGGS